MEYLLGSIVSIFSIIAASLYFSSLPKIKAVKLTYSQSHIYTLIKPLIPKGAIRKNTRTQSMKYSDSINIKVIIIESSAYWIKDNVFYTADIRDGNLEKDTTRQVDTSSMDKVQLDKMLFILDQLREGMTDDSRGSGN